MNCLSGKLFLMPKPGNGCILSKRNPVQSSLEKKSDVTIRAHVAAEKNTSSAAEHNTTKNFSFRLKRGRMSAIKGLGRRGNNEIKV